MNINAKPIKPDHKNSFRLLDTNSVPQSKVLLLKINLILPLPPKLTM